MRMKRPKTLGALCTILDIVTILLAVFALPLLVGLVGASR